MIKTIDLSPIAITEVADKNITLRFKESLVLTPTLSTDKPPLLIVDYPPINLYVYAYTRDKLIAEINEQILMMWVSYVQRDINKLSTKTKELRLNLLNTLEQSYE